MAKQWPPVLAVDIPAMSADAPCCSGAASFQDDLGLLQRVEDFTVQQFVAQFAVKAFAIAILLRTTRLDVSGLSADGSNPFPQNDAGPLSDRMWAGISETGRRRPSAVGHDSAGSGGSRTRDHCSLIALLLQTRQLRDVCDLAQPSPLGRGSRGLNSQASGGRRGHFRRARQFGTGAVAYCQPRGW